MPSSMTASAWQSRALLLVRTPALLVGILASIAVAGPLIGSAAAAPPVLTVIAGTGTDGPGVPGPAVSSTLNDLEGVGVDAAGNIYVPDNAGHRILKITPGGTLSVFAGNGTSGPVVPGPALSSPLTFIYSLTVDPAGDVFITDYYGALIEKVTPDGTLSIIGGNGTFGLSVAGPATSSSIGYGYSSAPTPRTSFRNDFDATIWKITPAGLLSKIAGNGTFGAAVPRLRRSPIGYAYGNFASDAAGNVYLGDFLYCDVVKITPGGTLAIVAGTGTCGARLPALPRAASSPPPVESPSIPPGTSISPTPGRT